MDIHRKVKGYAVEQWVSASGKSTFLVKYDGVEISQTVQEVENPYTTFSMAQLAIQLHKDGITPPTLMSVVDENANILWQLRPKTSGLDDMYPRNIYGERLSARDIANMGR